MTVADLREPGKRIRQKFGGVWSNQARTCMFTGILSLQVTRGLAIGKALCPACEHHRILWSDSERLQWISADPPYSQAFYHWLAVADGQKTKEGYFLHTCYVDFSLGHLVGHWSLELSRRWFVKYTDTILILYLACPDSSGKLEWNHVWPGKDFFSLSHISQTYPRWWFFRVVA